MEIIHNSPTTQTLISEQQQQPRGLGSSNLTSLQTGFEDLLHNCVQLNNAVTTAPAESVTIDGVVEIGENGDNAVLGEKTVNNQGLDQNGALQLAGGNSGAVVDIHASLNHDSEDSAGEVVVQGECGDVGEKELFKDNSIVYPGNEENAGSRDEGRLEKHEERKEDAEEKEKEDIVDDENRVFSVGEFVWAKTFNHPWWPGQVYDPSEASKDIAMYYRKGRVLVAFFGDETAAWCYPSLVLSFQENFEDMSKRGNSSSFHDAVKEALDRTGRCMEWELACSCVSPETQIKLPRPLASYSGIRKGVVVPKDRIVGLSIEDFGPSKFLARLKCIAEVVSDISPLEHIAFKSQLLAFSRVNRWCQLHIYLELQGVSEGTEKVEYATTDDFDFDAPMEESLVIPSEADLSSLTVGNGIGTNSSEENIYQKQQREMNDRPTSASRKRKRKFPQVGINGDLVKDGLSIRKSASTSKEQQKAKPSGSPLAFSHSEELTLQNEHVGAEEGNKAGSLSRERKKSKYLSPPYTMLCPTYKSLASLKDSVPSSPMTPSGEEYIGRDEGLLNCSGGTNRKKQRSGESQKKIETNMDVGEILSDFYSAALDTMYLEESNKYDCVKDLFLTLRSYRFGPNYQMVNVDVFSQPGRNTTSLDIEPALAGKGMYKTDSPTRESSGKKEDRQEDVMSHSPRIKRMDIVGGLLGEDLHKIDSSTSSGKGKRNAMEREEDLRSGGPRRTTLGIELGLPGKDVHENNCPKSGAKRKGRAWKEDARSQSSQKNDVEFPLGLTGEYMHKTNHTTAGSGTERKRTGWTEDALLKISQGKLFDVTVGTQGVYMRKTDRSTSEGAACKRGRKRKKDTMLGSLQIKVEHAASLINKKTNNKEAMGETFPAALILNFGPGVPLPTKEELVTLFGMFGELNKLETEVKKDSRWAQVVYRSRKNAEEAFKNSQQSSPFGPAVVNYRLQDYTANSTLSNPPPLAEGPPLQFVRQNLENMTSMLEKASGKLSPVVKVKLREGNKRATEESRHSGISTKPPYVSTCVVSMGLSSRS